MLYIIYRLINNNKDCQNKYDMAGNVINEGEIQ